MKNKRQILDVNFLDWRNHLSCDKAKLASVFITVDA